MKRLVTVGDDFPPTHGYSHYKYTVASKKIRLFYFNRFFQNTVYPGV